MNCLNNSFIATNVGAEAGTRAKTRARSNEGLQDRISLKEREILPRRRFHQRK